MPMYQIWNVQKHWAATTQDLTSNTLFGGGEIAQLYVYGTVIADKNYKPSQQNARSMNISMTSAQYLITHH
jgi:hypothetical protein